jgi:DNA-binding NtrC family response regulator
VIRPRLLFVEDDATLRKVLARELDRFGYDVHAFDHPDAALAAAGELAPDLALIDLKLPGMDGIELLARLLALDADLPIVLLTGHGAVPEAVEAMRGGAYDFLTKPCPLDVLEACLQRARDRRELRRENARLRRLAEQDPGGEIVGESAAIAELRATVAKIAASDANVLVLGENGTGKELVARRLHELGARRAHSFVVVNCAAIPAGLVESELFGHERGAFTGAERRRIGLLEAADGGTLFLDEVGELPLAVQPTLLRAVQFGEVRHVGGSAVQRVDLRVVAATHRDLQADVAAGRFREDLYYRLATLVVDVPPLRGRGADVELLATRLLVQQERALQRPLAFEPEALAALRRHDWPGNVRELENAIVRLATLAGGERIAAADVERHVLRQSRRRDGGALPTLDLDDLERIAVLAALEQCAGDKPRAAAVLGVSLKTLYNRLARYRGD